MLKINYDNKFDVLYISIGEPRPSYGEEETPGLVILKSIENDNITGITIFDFKKRMDNNTINELTLPFEVDFSKCISAFQ